MRHYCIALISSRYVKRYTIQHVAVKHKLSGIFCRQFYCLSSVSLIYSLNFETHEYEVI